MVKLEGELARDTDGAALVIESTEINIAGDFISAGSTEAVCPCQLDCQGRQCGPDGCGGTCPPGCAAGEACNPQTGQCECAPECADRECGPDGCGGRCEPGCASPDLCDPDGQCCEDISGVYALTSMCGAIGDIDNMEIVQDGCEFSFNIDAIYCSGSVSNGNQVAVNCAGLGQPCSGTVTNPEPWSLSCGPTCQFELTLR